MSWNCWTWIDRIEKISPGVSAHGKKQFESSNQIFESHFPGNPIVPGVLHVEMIAQLAAECLRMAEEKHIVMLSKIKSAKFFRPLKPMEKIDIYIEVLSRKLGCADIRGTIEVEGILHSSVQIQMVSVVENKSFLSWGLPEEQMKINGKK